MHSELACHIGLAARLFCRVCKVSSAKVFEKSGPEDDEMDIDELDDEDGGNDSDASSTAGRARASKLETLASMVSRITNFMKVSRLHYNDKGRY